MSGNFPELTHAAGRKSVLDLVIQIACLALLAYWTVVLVKPFLTIIIWSVILAVVIYPVFSWSVATLRVPRVAAAVAVTAVTAVTVVCLVVLLGPVAWLGLSLIETFRAAAERLASGEIIISPPSDSIKNWPIVGDKVYDFWLLASNDLKAAMVQIGPQLRPASSIMLGLAGSAGLNSLKFIVAAVISGFLLLPGPKLADSARAVSRRIAPEQGEAFVDLVGATIRNLARGLIGVSILQVLQVLDLLSPASRRRDFSAHSF
jgi:predicted PurR-regulated permease PerM